jgi:DNA-binding beta-propeller fold protein YncE
VVIRRTLVLALVLAALGATVAHAASWTALTATPTTLTATDLAGPTVASPITLDGTVAGVVIAPDGRHAYIPLDTPCGSGGVVQAIDLRASPPGRAIALGPTVSAISAVVAPDGRALYVGSSCANTVVPVDLTQARPVVGPAIAVGAGPRNLAVTPDGQTLIVANHDANTVSLVNLRTHAVRTVTGLSGPGAITVAPTGAIAWVADASSCEITPISIGPGVAQPPIALGPGCVVGASPRGDPADLVVSPDGQQLYASSPDAQRVVNVPAEGGLPTSIDLSVLPGFEPTGLTFTPQSAPTSAPRPSLPFQLLVTDGAGASMQIVNAPQNTLAGAPIALGAAGAFAVAVTPDQAPVAAFTVHPGGPGHATRFDASSSTAAAGSVIRWMWNWGDGSTQTAAEKASHVYKRAGVYQATLIEDDGAGTSLPATTLSTGRTLLRRGADSAQISRTFVVGHPAGGGPPVVGRRFVTDVVSGVVRIRVPRSRRFVTLPRLANIPTGSELDTTHGTMALTVARNSSGVTDSEVFTGGRVIATQTRDAKPATTLALSQPLTGCPKATHGRVSARASAARAKPPRGRRTRKVKVSDRGGNFKTTGQYAATAVEGTQYTVSDGCGFTRVDVKEGLVAVRDRVKRTTVVVGAGEHYIARAHR